MKKLLFCLVLAMPLVSQAITISVNRITCGSLGAQCDDLEDALRAEANKNTPNVSIDKYAGGISNSVYFAAQGQSSEYADDFSIFSVKATGATAVQGIDFSDLSKLEDEASGAEGIGIGASLSVGINLDLLPINKIGFLDLSKMDLFMTFMSYKIDQDLGETGAEGELSSFGVHARYRLFDSISFVPFNLLKWGGVQVHTGFLKNSMKIDLVQSLDDQRASTAGGAATADFNNASVNFGIDSNVMTIPVEVSTSFTLGYVLSLYTGVGVDFVSGETDIDLTAGGDISGTGGYRGTISASESGSGEANAVNQRAFLGAQFNLPIVKFYTHVNKALGEDLLSVGAGAKIAW